MTLNTGHNLGRAYLAGERWQDAERLYREIAELARRDLPKGHVFDGVFTSGLGAALIGQGRLEEAGGLLRAAVEHFENTVGADHRHTLAAWERLARTE